MKKLLFCICMSTAGLFSGELEESYKKIPEIMKNHELVVNVIWSLSKTNQLPFIVTMNNAIEAYPCSPVEKSDLRSEFRGWYKIATNNVALATRLQVQWNKQLEIQNKMGLLGNDVKSCPEGNNYMNDIHNPDGSEVITNPFFPNGIRIRDLHPVPFYGQY